MKILLQAIRKVLLIVFWLVSISSQAQFSFRHLTTQDGLIQGTVEYFMEDRRGYMWMTTQAGLNRFDGQNFKSYTHSDLDSQSIGKGQLHGIVEAPNEDIWVGTEVCLSRYSRETNKFQNYFVRDKNGKKLFSHHSVFFATDSVVWYLNSPEGVVKFNFINGKKQIILPDTGFRFESATQIIDFDPVTEILWLKQPFGVLKYNCRSKRRQYYFTGRTNDAFREKLEVYAFYSADHDSFWLSTNAGLIHLQNGKFEVHDIGVNIVGDPVYSLAMDKSQNLYITTSKSGLLVYDTVLKKVKHRLTHKPFQPNTIFHNHLSTVLVDRNGIVWANVDPQSVDIIYPSRLAPIKFADDPINPDDLNNVGIRGIAEDLKGNLWVGTIGEGIRKFSPDRRFVTAFRSENGLLQNNIRDILTDSGDNIWFCTKEGLNILRAGSEKLESITIEGTQDRSNSVRGIIEVSPEKYVAATAGGLYLLNLKGEYRLLADENEGFSGALFYDKKKNCLYAGRLDKDLRCYRFDGSAASPAFDALAGFNVLCITPFEDFLLIGTDNGLAKFNPENRKLEKLYGLKDGLPDHVIYSVLSDQKGAFWLSTNKGISRFDGKKSFRHIRQTQNIEFNSFSVLRAKDGGMFFGSVEGLYLIYPESFNKPSSKGLMLSQLLVNDSVFFDLGPNMPQDLEFRHDQNNLAFEASIFDCFAQIAPVFEYRIKEGTSGEKWISNGSNAVFKLSNLSPGKYLFEARALDANGFYTETKMISFRILPPFWRTWWFIALAVLLSGALLFGLLRDYLHRQQIAERKLTSRIIEAQEMERLRISQDLHDDVNNTLAAAKGCLQHFESDTVGDLTQNAAKSRLLIQKATEDLRNITHNLRPVEFEKHDLPEVIRQRVSEWNEVSDIEFEYIIAGKQLKLTPQSELMIYRIITELVQNIRKHSKANSAIIQLIYQEKDLVISLEDNGTGFSASDKNKNNRAGIGLKNLYSRAQFIKANLEINSDKNGVLVQLTVPYELNVYNPHSFG